MNSNLNQHESAAREIDLAMNEVASNHAMLAKFSMTVADDVVVRFIKNAIDDGLRLTDTSVRDLRRDVIAPVVDKAVSVFVEKNGIDKAALFASSPNFADYFSEVIAGAMYNMQVHARAKTLAGIQSERVRELHRKADVYYNPVNIGMPEMKTLSHPAAVSLSAAEALAGINARQERLRSRKGKR